MTLMSIVFVLYLVLVMVVGVIASRYGRSMEGYFLADRRLGAWVTAISSTASSESGWLVIGLVGEAYMWGAKAVWTVPGCLLGFVTNWLRSQSGALGAITVPDFFAERFRDKAQLLRSVGILIILLSLLGYVAAQFTATGKAFQGAFGISYQGGVLLGAVITILYTILGGFRAVSWTDLVQGLLMVFGLVVLPIVTISHVGGVGPLYNRLADMPARTEGVFNVTRGARLEQIGVEETPVTLPGEGLILSRAENEDGTYRFLVEGPAYVLNGASIAGTRELAVGDRIRVAGTEVAFEKTYDMVGGKNLVDTLGGAAGAAMLGWVIGLFGIGLGYPGQPHILVRFMAARSRRTIHRARLIALAWGALVLYGAVLLGNAARVAVPSIVDPEQAYPILATQLLPSVLAGIMLAAIVSAMMSTADSQLLVIASAVSRDFIQKILSPRASERVLGIITRLTVLVLGLIALLVALVNVRAVFWFVLFAWSGLGSAFGPPMLLSLTWKRTSRAGALAGMLSGFVVTVVWKLKLKAVVAAATGMSLYELVPAFTVSLLMTWIFSLLIPPDPETERHAETLVSADD